MFVPLRSVWNVKLNERISCLGANEVLEGPLFKEFVDSATQVLPHTVKTA